MSQNFLPQNSGTAIAAQQPDLFSAQPESEVGAHRETPGKATATPTRGRGLRDTSIAAYHAHKDSGKLGARQKQVYELLCRSGLDYTRAEIARAIGMTPGAACGRVNELLGLGVVVETPRRACKVTGASSHGVRVK